jgi:hypothetical protein
MRAGYPKASDQFGKKTPERKCTAARNATSSSTTRPSSAYRRSERRLTVSSHLETGDRCTFVPRASGAWGACCESRMSPPLACTHLHCQQRARTSAGPSVIALRYGRRILSVSQGRVSAPDFTVCLHRTGREVERDADARWADAVDCPQPASCSSQDSGQVPSLGCKPVAAPSGTPQAEVLDEWGSRRILPHRGRGGGQMARASTLASRG